ncbi:MAG: lipid A biosynthesis lauroyl acyltransferase, partial [Porticoccaceae bacterium]|nr:lipid A biosynthesis lauroyl acyltransferase [Porticoccaceae bacterium]
MSSNQAPEPSFLAPRYWPTWMGMGLLKLICKLPYSWQITLGRWLGIVMYHLFASRRHITDVNLRLCFPQLSDTERQAWVKQT